MLRVMEGIREGTRKGSWGGGITPEGAKGRVRDRVGNVTRGRVMDV